MSTCIFLFVAIYSSFFIANNAEHCWPWQLATPTNLADCDPSATVYQYKYAQTASRHYMSPLTLKRWSWTEYQEVIGKWAYTVNGGSSYSYFDCPGSENGQYGVGCSSGGGPQRKVLPIYEPYVPAEGLANICQDQPGIFGSGACHDKIDIFFRICAGSGGNRCLYSAETHPINLMDEDKVDFDDPLSTSNWFKFQQYSNAFIIVLLLMINVITICWCFFAKRKLKKQQYKIISMDSDLSETEISK
eukprot:188746_1